MYNLRRFHGPRFERVNAIIDSLAGHITSYVNLVGSASLPLPEVCAMQGLPATACRTEGNPGARLFPATDPMDQAEALIEDATRELFGLDASYSVNAQPHSATQANHAVLRAVLGDSNGGVAALAPTDGGHVSHRFGAPSSSFMPFPLGADGIDYDHLEREVGRHRPSILVAGGTSYTRQVDYLRLREIADRFGCHLHADLAHTAPFVAAGRNAPAFPHADSATIDTSKNLRGPRGGILIYRDADSRAMRRAVFPLVQSSPNQNGLLAKAACLWHWAETGLGQFCDAMLRHANSLSAGLASYLGPPVYGATDCHLLLFDLSTLPMTGKEGEAVLEAGRVLVNRNQVPQDPGSPWDPAGIRLGTTVLAILDYADEDVLALADAVGSILVGDAGHRDTIERLLDTYHRPIVGFSSDPHP